MITKHHFLVIGLVMLSGYLFSACTKITPNQSSSVNVPTDPSDQQLLDDLRQLEDLDSDESFVQLESELSQP